MLKGEEYKVEGIVWYKGKSALHQYLVLWIGYPITEASWGLVSHLKHAPLILEDYLCKVSKSKD